MLESVSLAVAQVVRRWATINIRDGHAAGGSELERCTPGAGPGLQMLKLKWLLLRRLLGNGHRRWTCWWSEWQWKGVHWSGLSLNVEAEMILVAQVLGTWANISIGHGHAAGVSMDGKVYTMCQSAAKDGN